jgi:hypothetical protein
MEILSFFGINLFSKKNKYENNIILWEDDYLMIEIISNDNLDFAKKETKRISGFGNENFDGNGFTEITKVGKYPVPTDKLKIQKAELLNILSSTNLPQIQNIYYNGESKPINLPNTIVFGEYNNGIFIESKDDLVTEIWFSSYNYSEISKTKIIETLNSIGNKYNMILVDWNKDKVTNLKQIDEINNYFNIE